MSRKLNLTNTALLNRAAGRAASLFGVDEGASLRELDIAAVSPNPLQPRRHFDAEALATLAASIERHGLLQPICVREIQANLYQIVAGERRYRAFLSLGRTTIPAMVTRTDDPATLALIENIQREDLDALELVEALWNLLNERGATQDQLAALIGKSQAYVSRTLRIMELPRRIRDAYAAHRHVPISALMIIAETPGEDDQWALWEMAREGLSVRALDAAKAARKAAAAPPPKPATPSTAASASASGRSASDPAPGKVLAGLRRNVDALRGWREKGGAPSEDQAEALLALRAEIDALLEG